MNRLSAMMLGFAALFLCASLACLRRWGAPEPWSRLDVFSGGYLLLSLVWLADQHKWHLVVFRSKELLQEAAGATYDLWLVRVVTLISVAELTVFFDYAHWQVSPWLALPWIQYGGLALSAAGIVWLMWTDSYLLPHFAGDMTARKVIASGPYRWVRHPRYLALLISRVSFAMIFASILAWGFVLLWLGMILRRIRLEEVHLKKVFGEEYEAYSTRTARLLPGVY